MIDIVKIRTLNDAFRTTLMGGRVMLTSGVRELGEAGVRRAMVLVSGFIAFCEDNDPHGEHDFGAFEIEGEKLFWKIDYYDKALEHGSEDPADPTRTTRVLTVMLASEY